MSTSDPRILILGEKVDPHIRKVCSHLKRIGAPYQIIDPFETVRLPDLTHPEAGVDSYTAVWDRLKPFVLPRSNRDQYIYRERVAAIRSLQLLARQDRLMNSLSATGRARSKLLQMRIARAVECATPRTYIGNDPKTVRSFVASCTQGAIAKSLTWYFDASGRFSFTKMITQDMLRSDAAIACSPLIYQEYIAKNFELRVTCVEQKIFAAKIFSQERHNAVVDWRRDQFKVKQEAFVLPKDVERKVLSILHALDLRFGAFDFIVTPEGDYVFLEVNSSGNWLWLENSLELPVSQAIADWLSGDRPETPARSNRLSFAPAS